MALRNAARRGGRSDGFLWAGLIALVLVQLAVLGAIAQGGDDGARAPLASVLPPCAPAGADRADSGTVRCRTGLTAVTIAGPDRPLMFEGVELRVVRAAASPASGSGDRAITVRIRVRGSRPTARVDRLKAYLLARDERVPAATPGVPRGDLLARGTDLSRVRMRSLRFPARSGALASVRRRGGRADLILMPSGQPPRRGVVRLDVRR